MKKTIKRISILALALVLMLGMTVTSFAGTSNVTYKDDAEEFIFAPGSEHSVTDLFPDFKGVMPGDSLTQQVEVKNEDSGKNLIRVYMRALGAHEDSVDFLSQMTLTVKAAGGDTELFNAPANQTAQLTDWVELGLFESGASVLLDVTLNVPIEMDDTFQNAIGMLDWQFKIERIPPVDDEDQGDGPTANEPTDKGDGESGSDEAGKDMEGNDENKDKGAQTGDDSNMLPAMLIGLAALIAMIIAMLAKRKKVEE